MTRIGLIALASVFAALPLHAQSSLGGAIRAGQAGERYDGYMGVAGSASPQVRRQVDAVNIHRRKLYIELARRRNVTAEVVGFATACELFTKLAAGEPYMLQDRAWRRHAAGQSPPVPDYCR